MREKLKRAVYLPVTACNCTMHSRHDLSIMQGSTMALRLVMLSFCLYSSPINLSNSSTMIFSERHFFFPVFLFYPGSLMNCKCLLRMVMLLLSQKKISRRSLPNGFQGFLRGVFDSRDGSGQISFMAALNSRSSFPKKFSR